MLNKNLYSEGLWILVAQIITAIASLVLIKVSTELLEPSSYGQLSILLTITFFISQVAIGGISVAVSRYYTTAKEIGDLKGYLVTIFKRILRANILISIAVTSIIIASQTVSEIIEIVEITLAVQLGVVTSSNSVLVGLFNSARERKKAALGQSGEILIRIVAILIVAKLTEINVTKIMGCYIIASIILLSIQVKLIKKLAQNEEVTKELCENWEGRIIKFALPFVPWNLVIWLQQSTDRWALSYFQNLQAVGIYSVLYQIGHSSLSMLFSVGIRFIQPILYAKVDKSIKEDKKNNDVNIITEKMVKLSILIGILILTITTVFHKNIFEIIVAQEYSEYSYYLPWITLAAILHGIGEIYLLKMQAQLMAKKLSVVKTSLGIFGMTISIIGAKSAGMDGLIVAMILFNLVNAIVMRYYSHER